MVALNCVHVVANPFLLTGAIAKSADVAPRAANSIIIFVMRCAVVFMKSGTRYIIRMFFVLCVYIVFGSVFIPKMGRVMIFVVAGLMDQ